MSFISQFFMSESALPESEFSRRRKNFRNRICRIEEVEAREMLSASPFDPPDNINVGAIYHEEAFIAQNTNEDTQGDRFTISWNGGAPGSSLTYICIDLSTANAQELMYFNTDPSKLQAVNGAAFPFTISGDSDILLEDITWNISEDGQKLEIFITEGVFTAGEKLGFQIDVNLKDATNIYPVVPGKHFENVALTLEFASENFEALRYETSFADTFRDPDDFHLTVPPDEFFEDAANSRKAMTAGVSEQIAQVQIPLPGSISGNVYEDRNNDGIFDTTNERGISGVAIELYVLNDQGVYESTGRVAITDENGHYIFDDVEGGRTYKIIETQPLHYADGKDTPGLIGQEQVGESWEPDSLGGIHLGAHEHSRDNNFGELKRGNLSGFVYHDRNNNGARETDEEGIGNVRVKIQILVDGVYQDVPGQVTRTDAAGQYQFENLDPFQTYRVVEVDQPAGFTDGKESIGMIDGIVRGVLPNVDGDRIEGIFLGYNESGAEYNFGEYKKGSISGYVYEDDDNDGVKDPNEKGIAGVEIWLCRINEHGEKEHLRKILTDENGHYSFDDLLPGETYCVTEFDPDGYCSGKNSVGTIDGEKRGSENLNISERKDQLHDIYLGSGEQGINYNFAENRRGVISGYVYEDVNKNHVRDNADNAISGVLLALWVWDDAQQQYVPTSKTAVTDENGLYVFEGLCPFNRYQVRETQPDGFDDANETVGTINGKITGSISETENDILSDILLPPGGVGENYNFGEVKPDDPIVPPPEKNGSLSGFVYEDRNKNGQKDASENGIAGVEMTLWMLVDDQYVDTGLKATTDADGYYCFENLEVDQTYQIRETQPDNFEDGKESVGNIEGKIVGSLPERDNDTISDIFVQNNDHGVEYNFGEHVKNNPPPPEPPTPPPTIPQLPVRPITPPRMPGSSLGNPGAFSKVPAVHTPVIGESLKAGYGGGMMTQPQSWHLSVLNAGYPRDTEGLEEASEGLIATRQKAQQTRLLASTNGEDARYVSVHWNPMPLEQSVWYVRDKNGNVTKRFTFGNHGAKPLAADFNGDGMAELAVYHNGNWYVDVNGNGTWDNEDLWVALGTASDQPVVGDWDGDGKADIGIFGLPRETDNEFIASEPGLPSDMNAMATLRPKNMPYEIALEKAMNNVRVMKHSERGQVRMDVMDHVFQYGGQGDQAIAGDFTGDGITKIGVYRNGKWQLDMNGNGRWDEGDRLIDTEQALRSLGLSGSTTAVVGDFNGDGIDNIGLFVDGKWLLDTTGDFRFDQRIDFGQLGDLPVVGDFNGDGIAELALYRASHADSLYANTTPGIAPVQNFTSPAFLHADAPSPSVDQGMQRIAQEFSLETRESMTDQGTLPEELQERTQRTPYMETLLDRHGR